MGLANDLSQEEMRGGQSGCSKHRCTANRKLSMTWQHKLPCFNGVGRDEQSIEKRAPSRMLRRRLLHGPQNSAARRSER